MDLFGLNAIGVEHGKAQKSDKSKLSVIETDDETLLRLLAGESYYPDDMIKHATQLVSQYKHDPATQFQFLEKAVHFRKSFEKVELQPDKPVFCIVSKAKAQWVLMTLIRKKTKLNEEIIVLYKDPSGNSIPEALETQIDKMFPKFKLIENNERDQHIDDESSYGALTLRNLNILLEFFQLDQDLLAFPKLQFARVKDLKKDRLRTVTGFIDKLAKEKKFADAVRKFMSNLPFELFENIQQYHKILKEESEKKRDEADYNKIKEAKPKYLVNDKIDKFLSDYSILQNEEKTDYQLQIEKDFPKQTKQFSSIFKLVRSAKFTPEVLKLYNLISTRLALDSAKMKKIFEYDENRVETKEILKIRNIEQIAKNLPEMKKAEECSNCASLDEVLAKIKVCMLIQYKPKPPEEKEEEEEVSTETDQEDQAKTDEKTETDKKASTGEETETKTETEIDKKPETGEETDKKPVTGEEAETDEETEADKKAKTDEETEADKKAKTDEETEADKKAKTGEETDTGEEAATGEETETDEETKTDKNNDVSSPEVKETKLDDEVKIKETKYVNVAFQDDQVQDVLEKYDMVEKMYEKWKNSDIQEIHKWAEKVKGNLGATEDNVCEAVAIMDRVYNLLNGGLRFRYPQILSILLFLIAPKEQGRVCEILPGEGKLLIIGAVAVTKCLQGHKVDVIMKTSYLADKAVKEMTSFFSVLATTVATNNADVITNEYSADVLIGTLNKFQDDYLRDILENQMREDRKFEVLILNEIDSMIIDKAENISRLSSFYAGFEFLRYVYIKIWQELHKVEKQFVAEIEKKVQNILDTHPPKEATQLINNFFQEVIMSERTTLKKKLKAANLTEFTQIPAHWKSFVDSHLDRWLKSALHAKYNCEKHKHYDIEKNGDDFKVVPKNYLNRGLSERNTVWVDGLRQFIELKHNINMSPESLASGYISNIGYIKKYPKENVLGLGSHLGSEGERELYMRVYDVNFVHIPPAIPSKFEELQGKLLDDESWVAEVTLNIVALTDDQRAVLAIFETEDDLTKVKKKLELLKKEYFRIRLLADEDVRKPSQIKAGDILLATDVADYGSNFTTVKYVEECGGLHVCLGFLPRTERIERQLFGRTARGGTKGTAQLLLKMSALKELGIAVEKADFKTIKEKRRDAENNRLGHVQGVVVKELEFLDKLYNLFIELYARLSQTATTERFKYALKDLKEFFAFWVAQNNYKMSNITATTPSREFVKFTQQAQPIIEGKICHSPYNCIELVQFYLRTDQLEKARSVLEYVLKSNGGKNDEILPGVHMKFFETNIKSGRQFYEKLNKTMEGFIPIKYERIESYKRMVNKQLDKALSAVKKEIEYIETLCSERNDDFFKILQWYPEENVFLRQIYSRLCCLQFYEGNIEHMMETIDTMEGDVDLNGRVKFKKENILNKDFLSGEQLKLHKLVNEDLLLELRSVGIDSIYSVGKLEDISDAVGGPALKHIKIGLTALTVGYTFPPSFTIMSLVASIYLSEGIVDLAMELEGKAKCDILCSDLIKIKLIQSRESILKLASTPSNEADTFIRRASTMSQECSSLLIGNRRLVAISTRIVNNIMKTKAALQRKVLLVKLQSMTSEERKRFQSQFEGAVLPEIEGPENLEKLEKGLKSFYQDSKTLVETNKSLWGSITKELMSPKLNDLSKLEIVIRFVQILGDGLRQNVQLIIKLQTTATEDIYKSLDGLTRKDQFDVVKKIIVARIIERVMATEIGKQFAELGEFIKETPILMNYGKELSAKLARKLSGGKANNSVTEVVNGICDKVQDKLLAAAREVLEKTRQAAEFGVKVVNLGKALHKRFCGKCCKKMKDYKLLGLTKLATSTIVKYQYRKQVLMISSDKTILPKDKEERLKRLADAYKNVMKYAGRQKKK